ncbi:hypothetical protein AWC27_20435 [Mycobacterium szulgai]|uniref:Uncharacterized protein n=1 Tax=Mycobacterium szulgai TaxID=1787 RepID=A0A1X2F7B3_MYCSZ|nr:hypothetical protein AWC27_20435 [Mycobacterium szulgai]
MSALDRFNRLRRPAQRNPRSCLAPENEEQEFARHSAQASCWLTPANQYSFIGGSPVDFESVTTQPPTQITAAAANVSPQGGVHFRGEATGPIAIGAANVLVMNKELVEIGQSADPANAKEANRRAGSDPRDE